MNPNKILRAASRLKVRTADENASDPRERKPQGGVEDKMAKNGMDADSPKALKPDASGYKGEPRGESDVNQGVGTYLEKHEGSSKSAKAVKSTEQPQDDHEPGTPVKGAPVDATPADENRTVKAAKVVAAADRLAMGAACADGSGASSPSSDSGSAPPAGDGAGGDVEKHITEAAPTGVKPSQDGSEKTGTMVAAQPAGGRIADDAHDGQKFDDRVNDLRGQASKPGPDDVSDDDEKSMAPADDSSGDKSNQGPAKATADLKGNIPINHNVAVAMLTDNQTVYDMVLTGQRTAAPHWIVLGNGTPVAQIGLTDQKQHADSPAFREVFCSPRYADTVLNLMGQIGPLKTLKEQNARFYYAQALRHPVVQHLKQRVATKLAGEYAKKTDAYCDALLDCAHVVVTAEAKNFWKDPTDFKKAMVVELQKNGLQAERAAALTENLFEQHGMSLFDAVIGKAREMMTKPAEYVAELKQTLPVMARRSASYAQPVAAHPEAHEPAQRAASFQTSGQPMFNPGSYDPRMPTAGVPIRSASWQSQMPDARTAGAAQPDEAVGLWEDSYNRTRGR